MTEQSDDKAISPKPVNLESGDIMMNVEPKVREATDNEAIYPEDTKLGIGGIVINAEATANETSDSKVIAPKDMMKLETVEIMKDVKPPVNQASDSESYPWKLERRIVNGEVTEQMEGYCDSSFKEEGDSSRSKSDYQEDILVENSPTKNIDAATGQLRRKSTLVVVGSNHKFNVRSRYLSDSTASCHDFCKFGHKHESENKTRRLTLGTTRESKPLIKTSGDDLEKCAVGKMTKKKELHRRLSHPGTMPEKASLGDTDLYNDTNQSKMKSSQSERKPSSVQSPKSSGRSKAATQAVKKSVTQSPNLQKTSTKKVKEVQARKDVGGNSNGEMEDDEKEPECSSSVTSLNKEDTYSDDANEIKEKEPVSDSHKTTLKPGYRKGVKDNKAKEPMSNSGKAAQNKEARYSEDVNKMKEKEPMSDSHKTTLKPSYRKDVKDIKAKEPMSNSVKTPLKKSPSLKARLIKNRRSSFNFKNQSKSSEANVDGSDDTIETNSNMERAEKTSKATIYGENSQHSSLEPQSRKPRGSDGKQKGIGASLLSFSSRESSKPHREKLGSEVTKNKKVGLKTEASGSKTSIPRENSTATIRLKSSNFKNTKQNDLLQDGSRSRTSTSREKPMMEQKWKPKTGKSRVDEKDASAWKVKFKRGTVVALQVANNTPKRLQFRRARTLGEDRIAKSGTGRQLKSDNVTDSELLDKIGPEKIRLRHQEASEKKDDVDLNNVIEETASKLVKTRKSKVKALVGAFETVMSLGDRKRLVEPGTS